MPLELEVAVWVLRSLVGFGLVTKVQDELREVFFGGAISSGVEGRGAVSVIFRGVPNRVAVA